MAYYGGVPQAINDKRKQKKIESRYVVYSDK